MSDILTIEEIESRFDSEWVLIEDPETDEALEVQRGKVVLHSKDRDEFDRQAVKTRLERFAVIYTGKPLEDMEYVL